MSRSEEGVVLRVLFVFAADEFLENSFRCFRVGLYFQFGRPDFIGYGIGIGFQPFLVIVGCGIRHVEFKIDFAQVEIGFFFVGRRVLQVVQQDGLCILRKAGLKIFDRFLIVRAPCGQGRPRQEGGGKQEFETSFHSTG